MTPSYAYIGVDAGSSGCKAVLLERGRVAASAYAAYPTERTGAGGATQDAERWFAAVCTTVRRCASAARDPVAGLSVTAPAHNAVLVERDGRPRSPVILWCDARPAATAAELRNAYGEAFMRRTHVRLDGTWTLPQLVWLRRQRPHLFDGLEAILIGKDYLRFRLTGVAMTDSTDAQGTALYEPERESWLTDVAAEHGLLDLLPPIVAATGSGGGLQRTVARRLGLRAGTPVVVGATDTAAELVSVDATRAGETIVKVATTGTVVVVSTDPTNDARLLAYPHPLGGWYSVAATSSAAAAYRWLGSGIANGVPERRLDRLAAAVPPGAGGLIFLPYLEGERTPHWDRALRGAYIGLTAAHGAGNLCRAVLEGVAFSLRDCLEAQREAGIAVGPLRLTGGGLASRLWRDILVAVLARPAQRWGPQGPALGSALLAGLGLDGRFPALRRRRQTVVPDASWMERYATVYPIYKGAAATLAPLSRQLTRLLEANN